MLREKGIEQDPYASGEGPEYYLQFYAPHRYPQLEALTATYLRSIAPSSVVLVHVTDRALYRPSQMLAFEALRAAHGEKRELLETPGHLICSSNHDRAVALFAHAAAYYWKAYLYCESGGTTLYNWDGEIFGFWTDSCETFKRVEEILASFKLRLTESG